MEKSAGGDEGIGPCSGHANRSILQISFGKVQTCNLVSVEDCIDVVLCGVESSFLDSLIILQTCKICV